MHSISLFLSKNSPMQRNPFIRRTFQLLVCSLALSDKVPMTNDLYENRMKELPKWLGEELEMTVEGEVWRAKSEFWRGRRSIERKKQFGEWRQSKKMKCQRYWRKEIENRKEYCRLRQQTNWGNWNQSHSSYTVVSFHPWCPTSAMHFNVNPTGFRGF